MQEAQQAQSKTQAPPNISDGCVGLRALAQPTRLCVVSYYFVGWR